MIIFLKGGRGRYDRVIVEDIRYLIADSNYTTVVTKEREFVIAKTLGALFEEFKKTDRMNRLIRINRSIAVNLDAIKQIEGNTIYIDGKGFVISRTLRHILDSNFVFI